jgi:tRNA(adenine34) deaminase
MRNFMLEAINEAEKAMAKGEVPIGAIVVKDGEIVGRGHNLTESLKDPTAHAEMSAIREAAAYLGGWRLTGCTMYVTVEPCSMCAGALVLSRVEKIYIGTMDPKAGACGSILNIVSGNKLNHEIEIETGVMQKECEGIMKDFFKGLRKKKSEEIQI